MPSCWLSSCPGPKCLSGLNGKINSDIGDLCGLGGIFIEVLKDVKAGLAPIAQPEALDMIRSLKSYKIIQGLRGQEPVNEQKFAEGRVEGVPC